MNTMDIIIRKHTFNETYNAKFFGSFSDLLSLDLEENTIAALFDFLENAKKLRDTVRPLITDEEGYPTMFLKQNDDELYGYSTLGFKDISIFESRMKVLPEFDRVFENIDVLWSSLKWTMSEPKIVKVTVGNFNAETAMYEGYPKTFEEVDRLWTQ